MAEKFIKVPRHFLDKESRDQFDREHPFYVDKKGEKGAEASTCTVDGDIYECTDDEDNLKERMRWERSAT